MHWNQGGTDEKGPWRSSVEASGPVVDSRGRALDRMRAYAGTGLAEPVLITGEPGAGKNWLARRFAEGLPAGWQTAEVELSSTLGPSELLGMLGDRLGLEMPERLGPARLRLARSLQDDAMDGRRWLLILDEFQRATEEVGEEIQGLVNRLGRPGGFSGLILLGRTEVVRELSTRHRRGWAGRLGLHIHLPPLDLDESRTLLAPRASLTEDRLERLHRDAMGNPRLMLRMIAGWNEPSRAGGTPAPTLESIAAAVRLPDSRRVGRNAGDRPDEGRGLPVVETPGRADEPSSPRFPSLIPARPPIRLEEGLVEVGWDGDVDAESSPLPDVLDHPEPPSTVEAGRSEEVVEDRYAALQAWAEWSRNRECPAATAEDRAAIDEPSPAARGLGHAAGESGPVDHPEPSPIATIRVEPPQDFAPYSPMFGRLRHPL